MENLKEMFETYYLYSDIFSRLNLQPYNSVLLLKMLKKDFSCMLFMFYLVPAQHISRHSKM